ncbi:MAG: hypothetical protein ACKPAE_05630 [Microcystis panniformis]
MYVLIGGAGMMGLGLAQQLLDLGHTSNSHFEKNSDKILLFK